MEQNENVCSNMDFNEEDLDSFLNKCTESWTCPLCAEKGVSARVRLYQANDHQAIYFCETRDCVYPQTDDSEPVVVNRTLLELPVDGTTLEKFGFPPSLLNEGSLTFQELYDICLIKDAYTHFDEWVHLEKELERFRANNTRAAQFNKSLKDFKINPTCTPLKYLRNIPADLMKYVRHFMPNVDEVVELLNLNVL